MSVQYTQANQPLAVNVQGLDLDALLLVGCKGEEEISHLFHYQLDLVAENPANIPFEKLLGRSVAVELELPGSRVPRGNKRFFNGICQRVRRPHQGLSLMATKQVHSRPRSSASATKTKHTMHRHAVSLQLEWLESPTLACPPRVTFPYNTSGQAAPKLPGETRHVAAPRSWLLGFRLA